MKLKTSLIVALLGFSVACSSDDNNDNNGKTTGTNNSTSNKTTGSNNTSGVNNTTGKNNTTGMNNTSGTNNTTGSNNATNNNTNNTTNNPTCNNTEFAVGRYDFQGELGGNANISIEREGSTAENASAISIEFYESADDAGDSPFTGPGTYEMGANEADLNYQTCTSCIRIATECTEGECAKQFFATKATVVINAVDPDSGAVSGTITNLEAQEVTINNDTFESTPVADGETFCVPSIEFVPECVVDADCTADAEKSTCSDAVCVNCVDFSSCTDSAKPACVEDAAGALACGVVTECMNDDAGEEDDGPAAATAVDITTLPAVINAKTCTGATNQETDWFKFTVAADDTPIRITLTADDPATSFDFILGDSQLQGIGRGPVFGSVLAAGEYLILAQATDTTAVGGGNEAAGYTITVDSGDCTTNADCSNGQLCDVSTIACVDCLTDLNCTDVAAPACISNVCGSHDVCTMDDANEPASDGPAGASALTLGTAVTNKICGDFASVGTEEKDWYKFEITAESNVRTTITWAEADPANPVRDVDVTLLDANLNRIEAVAGEPNGVSSNEPEILEISALPPGTYYLALTQYGSTMMAVSEEYTLVTETF